MKKGLVLFMVACLLGLSGGTALAVPMNLLSNGDFETGNLDSWNTSGSVAATKTTDGYFTEALGMDNYYALLGLDKSQGNSVLSQSFEVTGLDTLTISFNWAFDYWDKSFLWDDTFISFVRQDAAPAFKITLLDLKTNGTWFDVDADTKYGSYVGTIDITKYTQSDAKVVFKLQEGLWLTESIAGIDNVSVYGGAAPVPEPSTMILLGTGLLGLGYLKRRRQR